MPEAGAGTGGLGQEAAKSGSLGSSGSSRIGESTLALALFLLRCLFDGIWVAVDFDPEAVKEVDMLATC